MIEPLIESLAIQADIQNENKGMSLTVKNDGEIRQLPEP